MKNISIIIIFFLSLVMVVQGQEVIIPLQTNARLQKIAREESSVRKVAANQIITLPFFDDFSGKEGYPDPSLWDGKDVFINDEYAVFPPTVGVATFDAINRLGELHENASSFPFIADVLTSGVIRLDSVFDPVPRKIKRSDSLYFSFYYQPQGLGNIPAPSDSLVLEFLAPGETLINIIPADTIINGNDTTIVPADTIKIEGWRKMWSSPGTSLNKFRQEYNTWFRQVVIPVDDSARFYTDEFRFRFRNYATLADAIMPDWQSNGDQWNIDYVYLNIGRGIHDTLHRDVAFAAKAPNMLRTYTSMPYNQYKEGFINAMRDTLTMLITNLDGDDYNSSYRYEVSRDYGEPFHFYNGGNYAILPFVTSGYVDHQPFSRPPVNFVFPIGTQEKVFFTTTHILNTQANIGRKQNDTLRQVQVFANYLSYDDGTAEAGYGLTPAGGQMAMKFVLNRPDSLIGVNMYFNQTLNQGNIKTFYLNVWNDYFGEPGELIYSRYGYEPQYSDSLNTFILYKTDSVIQINNKTFPNLIFYVGFEQTTAANLNIGFDWNNDASGYTFWRAFGPWNSSLHAGTPMIRPVLGKEKVVGLDEFTETGYLRVFPNPVAEDWVMIELEEAQQSSNLVIRIFSADGRLVYEKPYARKNYIGELSPGFYLVTLSDSHHKVQATGKLMKK
ncbi:MAG: T9SS type A sorting domain-containing protein [Lentimicrobium sp.]|jgi:hypothetical protein|nr:T9SS type A sorting domain-containing protein [Lentimicrobium sp.]MDD2526748.1 T9SS type A sorting domain-containing protein [Lentimicrobiaceae bacterium]MDY0024714.1 T9SS type A sorting domain-containing protein [Lentimicrobium sp.]